MPSLYLIIKVLLCHKLNSFPAQWIIMRYGATIRSKLKNYKMASHIQFHFAQGGKKKPLMRSIFLLRDSQSYLLDEPIMLASPL